MPTCDTTISAYNTALAQRTTDISAQQPDLTLALDTVRSALNPIATDDDIIIQFIESAPEMGFTLAEHNDLLVIDVQAECVADEAVILLQQELDALNAEAFENTQFIDAINQMVGAGIIAAL